MGKVLTQAAWTLLPAAAAVVAAAFGAWWLVAALVVLAVAATATQSRSIQRRVPFLQTAKQKLAKEYDSCLALLHELRRQHKAGTLEPWDTWSDRVREWDRAFWEYMQRTRDDWRPMKRAIADPPEREFANWYVVLRDGLEARLTLIKGLMAE